MVGCQEDVTMVFAKKARNFEELTKKGKTLTSVKLNRDINATVKNVTLQSLCQS